MPLSVTVCQLHGAPQGVEADWPLLARHVRSAGSDLVVLPEMPFSPWLAASRDVEPARWEGAVEEHERWLERLSDLAPAAVAGSRPVTLDGERYNEGFLWNEKNGYRAVHHKVYLPDEPGLWEASWYEPGRDGFVVAELDGLAVGFLICSELWFPEHARAYGAAGAHLLATPRATPGSTADKWVAGGRVAAVVSGAYSLSSNRGGVDDDGVVWGGVGWIIEPEEGEVLALTSEREPFVTRVVDSERAVAAKRTYPRYIQNPESEKGV